MVAVVGCSAENGGSGLSGGSGGSGESGESGGVMLVAVAAMVVS